jgi:deoxycytidylate deaminase
LSDLGDALQAEDWNEVPNQLRIYDLFPAVDVNHNPIIFGHNTPSPKQDRFLQMAMGVALESECKFRHGAIVVKHGHILGSSPNVQKNDTMYFDHKHSQIHAEIAAMKKAGWPTKATIYVARVNGHGEARLSKPCANCQEVLDNHRIKVVYTKS